MRDGSGRMESVGTRRKFLRGFPIALSSTMSKKRILWLDDDRGLAAIIKLTLPSFDVRVENNPLKAVETARLFKPDMMFLDIIMPEANGGSVAAEFKKDPELAKIPIVFVTGILSEREAAAEQKIDGYEFLAKPVSRHQITSCVKRHLGT